MLGNAAAENAPHPSQDAATPKSGSKLKKKKKGRPSSDKADDHFAVIGSLPLADPFIGMTLGASGRWITDKKWGVQFKARPHVCWLRLRVSGQATRLEAAAPAVQQFEVGCGLGMCGVAVCRIRTVRISPCT